MLAIEPVPAFGDNDIRLLRCEEQALVAALRRQGKWQGEKPALVYAALRCWKGEF